MTGIHIRPSTQDDRDSCWSDVSASLGKPKIADNQQKLGKGKKGSFPETLETTISGISASI
jgi:hypothetical protein